MTVCYRRHMARSALVQDGVAVFNLPNRRWFRRASLLLTPCVLDVLTRLTLQNRDSWVVAHPLSRLTAGQLSAQVSLYRYRSDRKCKASARRCVESADKNVVMAFSARSIQAKASSAV